MKKLTRNLWLLLVLMFSLSLVACSDDDPPYVPIDAPVIAETGMPADAIIKMGKSITFTPSLNDVPAVYTWSVNGEAKAQTKDYTFTPTASGVYNLQFKASNEEGADQKTIRIAVRKYYGGFYIVNEGSYGTPGSIYYYDSETSTFSGDIFEAENDNTLNITTQHGAIWNENFYVTSKGTNGTPPGKLTVIDINTFKLKKDITLPEQGSAFQGISQEKGIVSTTEGVFPVDLVALTIGDVLDQSDAHGECGDIMITEEYLLILAGDGTVLPYSLNNFTFQAEKTIENISTGFARAKDGFIWAGRQTSDGGGGYVNELVKIDPSTLATTTVPASELNMTSLFAWAGAWRPTYMQGTSTDNTLYIEKLISNWEGGTEIYKFNTATNTLTPFATLSTPDYTFYGAPALHPESGELYVLASKESTWGGGNGVNNQVVIYTPDSTEKQIIPYEDNDGYLYPSMIIFE